MAHVEIELVEEARRPAVDVTRLVNPKRLDLLDAEGARLFALAKEMNRDIFVVQIALPHCPPDPVEDVIRMGFENYLGAARGDSSEEGANGRLASRVHVRLWVLDKEHASGRCS